MSDWTDNPFASPQEDSPFNDPSVTQVKHIRVDNNDYNPFQNTTSHSPSPTVAASEPLIPTKGQNQYISQSSSLMEESKDNDLTERERKLEQRERELAQKEDALTEERRQLQQNGAIKDETPNWPKFPKTCIFPFVPWIYHSISNDIPVPNQAMVFRMFNLWKFHILCYFLNWLANLALLGCKDCESTTQSILLSTFYMVAFVPGSFRLWYRNLYLGFKKDRSISFMIFFFCFGFQVLANIFFALGVSGTGAGGWMVGATSYKDSLVVAIFTFISASCWTVSIFACVYMIVEVHKWYKGTDYTIDRATGEVTSDAAQNETLRNGVINSMFG